MLAALANGQSGVGPRGMAGERAIKEQLFRLRADSPAGQRLHGPSLRAAQQTPQWEARQLQGAKLHTLRARAQDLRSALGWTEEEAVQPRGKACAQIWCIDTCTNLCTGHVYRHVHGHVHGIPRRMYTREQLSVGDTRKDMCMDMSRTCVRTREMCGHVHRRCRARRRSYITVWAITK